MSNVAATPAMAKAGISFDSVADYAKKSLDLLENHQVGELTLAVIDAGFRAYMALSTKDYITLLSALNDVNKDVQSIIAAIKAEFGL